MILSLYAAMLRAGIPLREADETELGMYLRVMGYVARQQEEKESYTPTPSRNDRKQSNVIELKRGTIDEFWG